MSLNRFIPSIHPLAVLIVFGAMTWSNQAMAQSNELMFLFGSVGSAELEQKIEAMSSNSGTPKDEVYLEYAYRVFDELNRRDDGQQSPLETIFSELLNQQVEISRIYKTYQFKGQKYPAAIIQFDWIILDGEKLNDIGKEEVNVIGGVLMKAIQSKSVYASINYF
jgi:hypothetical protein